MQKAKDLAKYHIKLKSYEGPFDVLLDLVARQQVDILEVDLARLTKDYLDFLKSKKDEELEVTTEFLIVAAVLLSIKASVLINEPGERIEIPQTPEELLKRLKELASFKLLSEQIEKMIEEKSAYFTRGEIIQDECLKEIGRIKPEALLDIYQEALRRTTPLLSGSHIITPAFDLERSKTILSGLLGESKRKITFSEIAAKVKQKRIMISIFYLLLAWAQEGRVKLKQDATFSDLDIELMSEC